MLLNVHNLSITIPSKRGSLEAVRGISFLLEAGKSLGIVGESGCGKSLTSMALMGLLPKNFQVHADSLTFEGQELLSLNEKQWQNIRGKKMSMIFQDPMSSLNPSLTIGSQLREVYLAHTQLPKEEIEKSMIELLAKVGITEPQRRLKSYPHQLSGGMCQRIMIAMAIANGPQLLLADEPTTALDVTIQAQIMGLIKKLQRSEKLSLIFVGHNLALVAQCVDELMVMYAGEIVEKGPVREVLENPKHPYTVGLLKSLPRPEEVARQHQLYSIPGTVPPLYDRPQGCQFGPRCPQRQDKCGQNPPMLQGESHHFACYYPQGVA